MVLGSTEYTKHTHVYINYIVLSVSHLGKVPQLKKTRECFSKSWKIRFVMDFS